MMFSFLSAVFVFILAHFYGIINGELALSVSHSLASSPKGGAVGRPGNSELDVQSPICAKGRALLQRAAASKQAHLVKLPRIQTAGHYCFRNIVLYSSSAGLPDTPVAPPLGELSRLRRD